MGKAKRKRILKYLGTWIFAIGVIVLGVFGLNIYFERLDAVAKEILEKSDEAYTTVDNSLNDEGLYVANIEEELTAFLEDKDINTITYEFEGENFYLEIVIDRKENGELMFEIEKIVNDRLGINARMNLRDVKSVEYRSDEISGTSLLKINAIYDTSFFAMLDGTYYFLGQDIESISYRDGSFYYLTYNPNYKVLRTATSCSNAVKKSIDGFNLNDYYYKYGKINFLTDYYQKLASKTYKVKERCAEFETKSQ